ncbi:MAG: DUF4372 domain-containing protein [Prevotellaceae bacterium]|nr:DUF4372 domain-containing protein [Prevotellaceae bacterium]
MMLFAVFTHFDSLREVELGMQAGAYKFTHLGVDYMVSSRLFLRRQRKRYSNTNLGGAYPKYRLSASRIRALCNF